MYRYDGYYFTQIFKPNQQPFNRIQSIIEMPDKRIWITTEKEGIFTIHKGILTPFSPESIKQLGHAQSMLTYQGKVWIFFDKAWIQVTGKQITAQFTNPFSEPLHSVIQLSSDTLMLRFKDDIAQFNLISQSFQLIEVDAQSPTRKTQILHQDISGNIWLGRSDGLYQFNNNCQCFIARHDILSGIEISTLSSDKDQLWIGTTNKGLYQFVFSPHLLRHYIYDPRNPTGLRDNSIVTISTTNNNVIWIGTFNEGINYFDKSTLSFGAYSNTKLPLGCLPSNIIYDIHEEQKEILWLATNVGISRLDLTQKTCKNFNNQKGLNALTSELVYSLELVDNTLLIGGSSGINSLNMTSHTISQLPNTLPQISTYFTKKIHPDKLLIGTINGLFIYDINSQNTIHVTDENDTKIHHKFYHFSRDNSHIYLGTNNGLYELIDSQLVHIPLTTSSGHKVNKITGLLHTESHGLIIAADDQILITVNKHQVIKDISYLIKFKASIASIYEIIQDNEGGFWMSSDTGIFNINLDTGQSHLFKTSDGLQSDNFLLTSSHIGSSGKIYFGGRQGFNAFYPNQIFKNTTPPQIAITNISITLKNQFSNNQQPKPILSNETQLIELNHKDLAVGFEFTALDFSDSNRNKYAYRLLGLSDNWEYVSSKNRQVNYTNLPPGEYTFEVIGSNKDSTWNDQPTAISIRVSPAPWFSPLSYILYTLAFIFSIWVYIRYKTINSRKRAVELETTVTERTLEVNLQKKMVESLLDHKNEVFANVTHEFKTPLALILGPIEQLITRPELSSFNDELSMIERNTKRLLLMVEHILKLSQAEQNKEAMKEPQSIQPILLMLHESFSPIASDKNISLHINNPHDVNISATHECIETVTGNLISNAIKYTQNDGEIWIDSQLEHNYITISVTDNGMGIRSHDLQKIFQKFVRLDNPTNVQGTGIGLSVVKTLTEANGGQVAVNSKWGEGTSFSVKFPVSDITHTTKINTLLTAQMAEGLKSELQVSNSTFLKTKSLYNNVLIIEDNLDMQQLIKSVLEQRFSCLITDRGQRGIALAFQEVPDIIICDIMMPGMDGYQVTRILRHDERTSHIPIVLLTALNTKESRIKGWRENIDTYITKPFSARELNAQLDNILNIRKIIQKKTNKAINVPESLDLLELPKQDLKFIQKLKDVIAQNYSNEYIQKADIASKMAISERQLQRKVKALTDSGPLEMLRNYRLDQSKIKLKDGIQVSIVSSECGFNSVSYYGSCFKKKFGMTPMQYQKLK